LGLRAFSLMMIPFSQYLVSVWLQVESILKTPLITAEFHAEFQTLGDSKKISQKFGLSSIVEMIILLVMSIEAIHHPQLVDRYFVLYILPFGFIFLFSLYFALYDHIDQTSIELRYKKVEKEFTIPDKPQRRIHLLILSTVLVGCTLWIVFSILSHFGMFKYVISIPGTSPGLNVSYFIIFLIVTGILLPIGVLFYSHIILIQEINQFLVEQPPIIQKPIQHFLENHFIIRRFFKA
jgi:hypothetical protein